jgi:hypothetical protein
MAPKQNQGSKVSGSTDVPVVADKTKVGPMAGAAALGLVSLTGGDDAQDGAGGGDSAFDDMFDDQQDDYFNTGDNVDERLMYGGTNSDDAESCADPSPFGL